MQVINETNIVEQRAFRSVIQIFMFFSPTNFTESKREFNLVTRVDSEKALGIQTIL